MMRKRRSEKSNDSDKNPTEHKLPKTTAAKNGSATESSSSRSKSKKKKSNVRIIRADTQWGPIDLKVKEMLKESTSDDDNDDDDDGSLFFQIKKATRAKRILVDRPTNTGCQVDAAIVTAFVSAMTAAIANPANMFLKTTIIGSHHSDQINLDHQSAAGAGAGAAAATAGAAAIEPIPDNLPIDNILDLFDGGVIIELSSKVIDDDNNNNNDDHGVVADDRSVIGNAGDVVDDRPVIGNADVIDDRSAIGNTADVVDDRPAIGNADVIDDRPAIGNGDVPDDPPAIGNAADVVVDDRRPAIGNAAVNDDNVIIINDDPPDVAAGTGTVNDAGASGSNRSSGTRVSAANIVNYTVDHPGGRRIHHFLTGENPHCNVCMATQKLYRDTKIFRGDGHADDGDLLAAGHVVSFGLYNPATGKQTIHSINGYLGNLFAQCIFRCSNKSVRELPPAPPMQPTPDSIRYVNLLPGQDDTIFFPNINNNPLAADRRAADRRAAAAAAADAAAGRPNVAAVRPDVAAGRPDVAAGRPDVAAGRPDVAAGRPDVAAVRPDVAAIPPCVGCGRVRLPRGRPGVAAAAHNVNGGAQRINQQQQQQQAPQVQPQPQSLALVPIFHHHHHHHQNSNNEQKMDPETNALTENDRNDQANSNANPNIQIKNKYYIKNYIIPPLKLKITERYTFQWDKLRRDVATKHLSSIELDKLADANSELIRAAYRCCRRCIKKSLLDGTAMVETRDSLNATALMIVTVCKSDECVRLLVRYGLANVFASGDNLQTPMHLAMRTMDTHDDFYAAKWLRDCERCSTLTIDGAANIMGNSMENIREFIERKISDDKPAMFARLPEMNPFNGEFPNNHNHNMNEYDEELEAISDKTLKIVKELHKAGGNMQLKDNFNCRPMQYACIAGYLSVIEYLNGNGIEIDWAIVRCRTPPKLSQLNAMPVNILKSQFDAINFKEYSDDPEQIKRLIYSGKYCFCMERRPSPPPQPPPPQPPPPPPETASNDGDNTVNPNQKIKIEKTSNSSPIVSDELDYAAIRAKARATLAERLETMHALNALRLAIAQQNAVGRQIRTLQAARETPAEREAARHVENHVIRFAAFRANRRLRRNPMENRFGLRHVYGGVIPDDD